MSAVCEAGGSYGANGAYIQVPVTLGAPLPLLPEPAAADKDEFAPFRGMHAALERAKAGLDPSASASSARVRQALVAHDFLKTGKLRQQIVAEWGGEGVSNAWLKAYELVYRQGLALPRLKKKGGLRVFCNAELPGAFLCGINHLLRTGAGGWRQDWEWVASSLLPGGGVSLALGDQYRLLRRYPRRWLMGQETSGDLTVGREVATLARLARERLGGGADLYTADGGIALGRDYRDQEGRNAHLHLGQAVCGLLALRPGGSILLKHYTLFAPHTVSLVAYLAGLFDEFRVVKPRASRPCNSETYLAGRGFRGLPDGDGDRLLRLLDRPPALEKVIAAVPAGAREALERAGQLIHLGQQRRWIGRVLEHLRARKGRGTRDHGQVRAWLERVPIARLARKDRLT